MACVTFDWIYLFYSFFASKLNLKLNKLVQFPTNFHTPKGFKNIKKLKTYFRDLLNAKFFIPFIFFLNFLFGETREGK
jgi:glycopeptide antibiotics resistance protein